MFVHRADVYVCTGKPICVCMLLHKIFANPVPKKFEFFRTQRVRNFSDSKNHESCGGYDVDVRSIVAPTNLTLSYWNIEPGTPVSPSLPEFAVRAEVEEVAQVVPGDAQVGGLEVQQLERPGAAAVVEHGVVQPEVVVEVRGVGAAGRTRANGQGRGRFWVCLKIRVPFLLGATARHGHIRSASAVAGP